MIRVGASKIFCHKVSEKLLSASVIPTRILMFKEVDIIVKVYEKSYLAEPYDKGCIVVECSYTGMALRQRMYRIFCLHQGA